MDRQRERDAGRTVRRVVWLTLAIMAIVAFIVIDRVWLRSFSAIDLADFMTAKVERGTFQVEVRGAGVLEPIFERWVTARVEGTVEEIFARVGQEVDADAVIVSLVNPELHQAVASARLSLIETNADHRRRLAELTDRRLEGEARLLDQQATLDELQLRLEALTELRQEHAISEIDYKSAQIRAELAIANLDFQRRRFTELQEVLAAEQAASEARLAATEAALREAERRVEALLVIAGTSGTLREILVEPGRRLSAGAQIARLVDTSALMGVIRVPESYASRVTPGQSVVATIFNVEVPGVVTRVDPAVTQGSVTVDIKFTDKLPTGARPDLSIRATIVVAALHDTVFVRRPLQIRDDSTSEVFRLTAGNQSVNRVMVRFGIGSLRDIQVLDGLVEGDTIIISDTSQYIYDDTMPVR